MTGASKIRNLDFIVNVKDFGAKGDGVTDDRAAIQAAINSLPAYGGMVVFPRPSEYYLINSYILLRSNIILEGQMSTVFMPSHTYDKHNVIFNTNSTEVTSKVTIKNFVLKSINEVAGTGYWAGSLVSNNHGFYLQNTQDIIIENITMANFDNGIKLSTFLNKNIYVQNVAVYTSMTPIYMSNSNTCYFTNLVLDNTGAVNDHLHCIYISGNCNNLYWSNVTCMNTSGGGIHIWNGYADMAAADTAFFNNIVFNNCNSAVIIGDDAKNISINNFHAENCLYILRQYTSDNVRLEKGTVKLKQFLCNIQGGVTNTLLKDILVDCSTSINDGILSIVRGDNLIFDSINCRNARANHGFVYNSDSPATNMKITNCKFNTNEKPNNQQISFRNAASGVIIENCEFINNGAQYSNLCYNFGMPSPFVLFRNNYLQGWKSCVNSADTATVVVDCYNKDRGGIEVTRNNFRYDGTVIPVSGTYNLGDEVYNTNPIGQENNGIKYIVTGWKCIAGGNPGKWAEVRLLTGN